MADDVKWIRFKVGTFDGMSFKRIKKAKIDGVVNLRDKLTAVWFELLDLGGKVNNQGFLVNDELAFRSYDDIAIVLDRTTEEVEMCIKWFINEKMMEITDDILMISNWSKYQNIDGLEKIQLQNRERQARFKERKKQLALEYKGNVTDNVMVTHGNAKPLIDNNSSSQSLSLSLDLDFKEETLEDLFNDFWNNYPRKVSKGQAETTFRKLKPNRELVDIMVLKLQALIKNNWAKRDKDKIPHASTWLNAKGWEDEIEESADKKKMSALERFMNE